MVSAAVPSDKWWFKNWKSSRGAILCVIDGSYFDGSFSVVRDCESSSRPFQNRDWFVFNGPPTHEQWIKFKLLLQLLLLHYCTKVVFSWVYFLSPLKSLKPGPASQFRHQTGKMRREIQKLQWFPCSAVVCKYSRVNYFSILWCWASPKVSRKGLKGLYISLDDHIVVPWFH
jgi:hypothetical protein